MDVTLPLLSPLGPAADRGALPTSKSAEAATQFEGLMIAQLLRSSHEEGSGWFGSGEDSTAGQANAIAEEFLAQALAAKGGLGIARMVKTSLAKSEAKPESAGTQASPGSSL